MKLVGVIAGARPNLVKAVRAGASQDPYQIGTSAPINSQPLSRVNIELAG